jgi:ZIP family zinc transporter
MIHRGLRSEDNIQEPDYVAGFCFTVVAGLATVIGTAFIPLLKLGNQEKVTSGALAFAAGVMLYVSFVDVLGSEAKEFFSNHFESRAAASTHRFDVVLENDTYVRVWTSVFFFLGLAVATLLDSAVSSLPGVETESARSSRDVELMQSDACVAQNELPIPSTGSQRSLISQKLAASSFRLERVSAVAFIALTLHNIPEGLATFLGGGTGSLTVPFAIAMHNIPEGAAIAIPCYQVSGSMHKAVVATFIASLAQPLGAAIGWFLLVLMDAENVSDFTYGAMYSLTAGIMISVSIMELIPSALEMQSPRFVGICTFVGFFVMECSIIFLGIAGAS